jgi:hypothetical protein
MGTVDVVSGPADDEIAVARTRELPPIAEVEIEPTTTGPLGGRASLFAYLLPSETWPVMTVACRLDGETNGWLNTLRVERMLPTLASGSPLIQRLLEEVPSLATAERSNPALAALVDPTDGSNSVDGSHETE